MQRVGQITHLLGPAQGVLGVPAGDEVLAVSILGPGVGLTEVAEVRGVRITLLLQGRCIRMPVEATQPAEGGFPADPVHVFSVLTAFLGHLAEALCEWHVEVRLQRFQVFHVVGARQADAAEDFLSLLDRQSVAVLEQSPLRGRHRRLPDARGLAQDLRSGLRSTLGLEGGVVLVLLRLPVHGAGRRTAELLRVKIIVQGTIPPLPRPLALPVIFADSVFLHVPVVVARLPASLAIVLFLRLRTGQLLQVARPIHAVLEPLLKPIAAAWITFPGVLLQDGVQVSQDLGPEGQLVQRPQVVSLALQHPVEGLCLVCLQLPAQLHKPQLGIAGVARIRLHNVLCTVALVLLNAAVAFPAVVSAVAVAICLGVAPIRLAPGFLAG
mmetsp:Transcript_8206/g.29920  ORF Transcript_8206/g.29920 Transcript_8206/m.29920 type:complete len:382 (+) Transcript_8206:1552-2697(+)